MDCSRDLAVKQDRHQGVRYILIWNGYNRGRGNRSVIRQPPNPLTKVFTGEVPFSEIVVPAAMKSIMDGERPMRPNHPDLTESLWTLTQKCWADEARDRPKMWEVIKVLKELLALIPRLYGELFTHASSQKHSSGR